MDANGTNRKTGTTGARAIFLDAMLASLITTLCVSGGVWAKGTTVQQIKQQIRSGGYRLVLQIGPPEVMSMNAKTGERMLGGKSATCGMKGMKTMAITNSGASAMLPCNHHLELHVYKGKQVLKNARVNIAVINAQRHFMMIVPIMTMYRAGKGMRDFHYGNNVLLAAGDYSVQATVNTNSAVFGVHLM
jgi:hypothetical protein